MNDSMERALADWLRDGPDRGPQEGLDRALAATRRVSQRPGWTLPERWIPMQMSMARTPPSRPLILLAMFALLLLTMVAGAWAIGGQRHQLPEPLFRNGAIVYERGGHLFIADQLDGTPRRLVPASDPFVDSMPAFAPQGDRIAFVRDGQGEQLIKTIRPDGAGEDVLANLPGAVESLVWSPDGQYLLASTHDLFADTEAGARQVFRIDTKGAAWQRFDFGVSVASQAAWRPDGRQFAFAGWEGDSAGTFIVDADGTNLRRLPIEAVRDLAWSPDGRTLTFLVEDPLQVADSGRGISRGMRLATAEIDQDGSVAEWHALRLDPGTSQFTPAWSPDGSRIAFVQRDQGNVNQRVAIVEPDGTGLRLVGPPAHGGWLDFTWSPDGRSLVIHRADDRVWSVDVATGEQTEVQNPVGSWQRLAP